MSELNTAEQVWSCRLATGLFGLTNCSSGNRGPKNDKEVVLFIGDKGLRKLVRMGFIPCPVCKPENKVDWEVIKDIVKEKYGMNSLSDFTNKRILPYDARRIAWEELLPIINGVPGRIYLPQGLTDKEVDEFRDFIDSFVVGVPTLGYYKDYKFIEY